MRITPGLGALGALVLVTSGVTAGCGIFNLGTDNFADALDAVPSGADYIHYVDAEQMRERLKIDAKDAKASEAGLEDYVEELVDAPVATELDTYAVPMKDAAFSSLDVIWEVSAATDDALYRAWRISDDVDLEEVADDMEEAGFERDEIGGHPHLSVDPATASANGLVGDRYPAITLLDTVLIPDEHLILSSGDVETLVDVADGEQDSMSDSDAADDLADGQDDIEFAYLAFADETVCTGGLGQEVTPEGQAAFEANGLGTPEASGSFLSGSDPNTQTVLLFDNEDDAKEDAEAREDYLDEGSDPISRRPYDEFGSWDIKVEGQREIIDVDLDELRVFPQMVRDGNSFGIC